MGYDMHFRDNTERDEGYFRLNIWGMSRYREYMAERGMVFDAGQHPDWPDGDEGLYELADRLRYPEYYTDKPPLTEDETRRAKEHEAANDAVLSWHGPETPGIPIHKFGSNDGWIVLPVECQAALGIYMAKLEEVGQDAMANLIDNKAGNRGHWAQWLAYLNGAITHDGFEVH